MPVNPDPRVGGGFKNQSQTTGRPGYPASNTLGGLRPSTQATPKPGYSGAKYGMGSAMNRPNPSGTPSYSSRPTTYRVVDPATSLYRQLNPSVYAQADRDIGTALAMERLTAGEKAIGDAQANSALDRAEKERQLQQAGLGIDQEALNRQRGYLDALYNIANGQGLLNFADIQVDDAAEQRQYGLINASRQMASNTYDRANEEYGQNLQRITSLEKEADATHRDDQQKLIAKAAAQGNVGLVNTMDSAALQRGVTDQLAELARNRDEARRRKEEAFDAYGQAMRELQEREYQTNDARERLKIKRERERLQQEQRNREHAEAKAKLEDDNRKNFLQAAMFELEARRQRDEANAALWYGNIGAAKAAAERQALIDAANAAKFAEAIRAQQAATANPVYTTRTRAGRRMSGPM